jgi:hypothetical protein
MNKSDCVHAMHTFLCLRGGLQDFEQAKSQRISSSSSRAPKTVPTQPSPEASVPPTTSFRPEGFASGEKVVCTGHSASFSHTSDGVASLQAKRGFLAGKEACGVRGNKTDPAVKKSM